MGPMQTTDRPTAQRDRRQPAVSVIMIFLNARAFIAQAIESVLAQDFPDWELVLVDDGSTDGSRAIAASYAERNPERIRLHEHPGRHNLGTGASRNLGMQVARGRYLAFLDADDIYEPERLTRTVALLDADPLLDVVVNRELYWRSWQEGPGGLARLLRLPDDVFGMSAQYDRPIPPPILFVSSFATPGAAIPGTGSITFRRASVERLGGIPARFTRQYEDQALIAKLLLHGRAMVIRDCLARYRQHPHSLTRTARREGTYAPGRPHEARIEYLRWLEDYARECGFDDALLLDAIARELDPPQMGPLIRALDPIAALVPKAVLCAANLFLPRAVADDWLGRLLTARKARATRRALALAERLAARYATAPSEPAAPIARVP